MYGADWFQFCRNIAVLVPQATFSACTFANVFETFGGAIYRDQKIYLSGKLRFSAVCFTYVSSLLHSLYDNDETFSMVYFTRVKILCRF